MDKIKVVFRDEGETVFVLKDGEYSGRYRLLNLRGREDFERLYDSHNMQVETEKAQYIAAALASALRSKKQDI